MLTMASAKRSCRLGRTIISRHSIHFQTTQWVPLRSGSPLIMPHSHVTQVTQCLSVMVISAAHAQSLSFCHAIPSKGRYCHPLVWAPTPKYPGFPVPVLFVSEECALSVQPHVSQSIMLDYTSWLPSPCIGQVMIIKDGCWKCECFYLLKKN